LSGEDCSAYPFEVCNSSGVCEHKDVFPAEPLEIFGYVIMPFLFSLASVGGIGGGIIFVPLTIGVFNFRTKEAIAIASAIVLMSAVIRFTLMSAYAPHPERKNATQIDYNLIKVVFPIFLTGSYFGVLLSVSLGELILAVCMMTLLTLLSFQTLYKAVKLYKKENLQRQNVIDAAAEEATAATARTNQVGTELVQTESNRELVSNDEDAAVKKST